MLRVINKDLMPTFRDLLGIVVQPLDLHLVNVGSIPTGPTHGEGCLQPHPGEVLKSTSNVRKSPRSGLNLEGRLSDPQIDIVDGIRSATVRRNSTLIIELSTPNVITAPQQDTTQTVVQRQLREV